MHLDKTLIPGVPVKNALFTAQNLADTRALGAELAGVLPEDQGVVIALEGPLGAGKTHFVQALAAGLGYPPENVTSPTFVLINEYPARRPIYHFDAYRVADDDEFLALGPEEYFHSQGVCLVEWASRVRNCLPRELLQIDIAVLDESQRSFAFQAIGERYERLLERLSRHVSRPAAR